MDVSSAATVPAAIAQASTGDAIAISVMKKALDIQAQSAMQLLRALPLPSTNNPPNLGNRVNTFA